MKQHLSLGTKTTWCRKRSLTFVFRRDTNSGFLDQSCVSTQPPPPPPLEMSRFVNDVALCSRSDHLISTLMCLHWRCIKAWCVSSRRQNVQGLDDKKRGVSTRRYCWTRPDHFTQSGTFRSKKRLFNHNPAERGRYTMSTLRTSLPIKLPV